MRDTLDVVGLPATDALSAVTYVDAIGLILKRKDIETVVVFFVGVLVSNGVLDVLFPGHPRSKGWYLVSGWGPFLANTVLMLGVLALIFVVRARHDED